MALLINDECIVCGACIPECPNDAITDGDPIYIINPDLCTECVGFFDSAQCVDVCPTDSCVPDPECKETAEELQAKKVKIHGS